MTIPTIDLKTKESVSIRQKEFDITLQIIINFLTVVICPIFNITVSSGTKILDELFCNQEILNYCTIRFIEPLNKKFFLTITSHEGYLATPGTILNAAIIYVLIRHFKLKDIFEAGTATGFYSSFLLLAAIKNDGHLTTCDLVGYPALGSMILNSNSSHLTVLKQTDSIDYLKQRNKDKKFFDFYVHDSEHTFEHMFKELYEFKKCEKDLFFCFFDDQRSDNFWNRCITNNLFKKQNYDIKFTNEEKQLGGFINYAKI